MSTIYKRSTKEFINNEESSYIKEKYIENMAIQWKENPGKYPGALLLDSSLISATQYNYKIIECGEYIQVYKYSHKKISNKDKKDKKLLDYDYLFSKKENIKKQYMKYL